MNRLPIRARLTLPFAVAMAVVLVGLGALVYVRVGATLLDSIDRGLRVQATEARTRLEHGSILDRDAAGSADLGQVLDEEGAVVKAEPSSIPALLSPEAAAEVLSGHPLTMTSSIPGQDEPWRLYASVEEVDGARRVLVIGAPLEARDASLERLRKELLIAAPMALFLAVAAGYFLAGAALRPVEAMRRKAAAISAANPESRLPVPRARDEVSALAVTLNDMLGRLEGALDHERRFVADASHELRTPLSLLRTELELALRRPRSPAELEAALRSAAEETDRLIGLASDLLVVAQADRHALSVQRTQVDPAELLGAIASRFAGRAETLGRRIEIAVGDGAPFSADRGQLDQAVGNLVENALVHGDGAVVVSARRRDGTMEIHVEDEGTGLPPAFIDRAFDRFSRADDARRRAGSGLGLAIVQAIAVAHGGFAGVANRPAGGADVWIALPDHPVP